MFPHYQQLDEKDCGPTALRIISKYYGKHYQTQTLRDKCHVSKEGVSMLGISDAAEDIGFRSIGIKVTWEQLRDEVKLPCIVYWNQEHFIVVYKIERKRKNWKVYVSDPAEGLLVYKEEAFLNSWLQVESSSATENFSRKGLALQLEPTPKFYQEQDEGSHTYNLKFINQYIRPYIKYLIHLGSAMLIGSLISLLLPFITQSVVDRGIEAQDISYVIILLIAQVALVIGQLLTNLIQSRLMLHITTRVSISLISDFLCKLMKLPIAFFDSKMTGDIIQRIDDYNKIQSFLTSTLLSIVIAIISLIIYGTIMAGYNGNILLIFIVCSIVYILWVLLFIKYRRKLDYMRFQQSANNQSTIIELINGMQDIKLNGCEKQKRWNWERVQALLFKISIKSQSLDQIQKVGGTFIEQTKNVIISFIAATAVIEGGMTLGMMMALQYIMGQLNVPIAQFIQFVHAAQDASIATERLGEIHERNDEDPEQELKIEEIPQQGDIVFENVTFQYDGPRSAKVLDNINLVIPHNKVTAIVGASGSGKTTMLKMILGFYEPIEGSITLGKVALSKYSARKWRQSCGVVMQEGYIFSDSIANNIAVSDEIPDLKRVKYAVEMANISDWIEDLPMGFNTRIGIDGHGLSTGQKQRLLIARAAYKNANYLILDEATNSLDANNERFIMENLQELFINKTAIIVAHRLSTVKNADNIVVLNNGRIVESGTHRELVCAKGYYYNLIKNQLDLGE